MSPSGPLDLTSSTTWSELARPSEFSLRERQQSLALSALATVQSQIPEGTAVARLLANITSLTKPETVKALAHLSAEEESRLTLLERSLLDLQASDPNKLIRQLTLRGSRVEGLARHFKAVEAALAAEAVDTAFNARAEGRRKREAAKRLRAAAFQTGMLAGTGSETWAALWESAHRFSQESAYSKQPFSGRGERRALRALPAGSRRRCPPQTPAIRGVCSLDHRAGTPAGPRNRRATPEELHGPQGLDGVH